MNNTNNRNPVLLIHGINDTGAIFKKMSGYLNQLGWNVYDINLIPSDGKVGLDELAAQVADWIANTFTPEQPLDMVGFSMGGIVSRYYVQRLGGINRIRHLVTISAPHHGSLVAYYYNRPGCIQMRPNSDFLNDLNQDVAMLEQINFTSIWTPFDLMIVPSNSSIMPVGKNVQVPVLGHAWMVTDPQSLTVVAAALSEPFKQVSHPPEQIRDRQKLHFGDSKT